MGNLKDKKLVDRHLTTVCQFIGLDDYLVVNPTESKKEDYIKALIPKKSYDEFESEKWDCEEFEIFKADSGKLKYAYLVHDPGVYRHSDGSGTPPSDELREVIQEYNNVFDILESIARTRFEIGISEADQYYSDFIKK
jgi:hypothetical protein